MSIPSIDLANTGSWALNIEAKKAIKNDGTLKVKCNGQTYEIKVKKFFGNPTIESMTPLDQRDSQASSAKAIEGAK